MLEQTAIVIGVLLTFLILELTIIAYFKTVVEQNAEQIAWKEEVNSKLDGIELRLHWQDIGFETNFKFFEMIFDNLDIDEKTRGEVSKEIRALLMRRLPSINPAYKKGSELERYYRQKLDEWDVAVKE